MYVEIVYLHVVAPITISLVVLIDLILRTTYPLICKSCQTFSLCTSGVQDGWMRGLGGGRTSRTRTRSRGRRASRSRTAIWETRGGMRLAPTRTAKGRQLVDGETMLNQISNLQSQMFRCLFNMCRLKVASLKKPCPACKILLSQAPCL